MIKIVYDNVIFSLQKAGGVSVYWKELLDRMQNQNVCLKILEYTKAESNIFRNQLTINNKIIQYKNKFPFITIIRYLNLYHNAKDKTIFHSSYYRIMRGKNIVNVVTLHDFIHEKKFTSLLRYIHIIQKKKALFKADGIICISQNTKNDLLELYPKLKSKRIKVVYHSLNKQDYYSIKGINIENTVVFVSARKGYKNFNHAVEIISKVEGISLSIVGAPLVEREKDFLDKIIPNRYAMYANINSADLNIIYNKAICLIYLSEYEGFGIPLLEAMSAGCPVIALNKSSIPEVVGMSGILFDDIDYELVRNAIIKLKENKAFREQHIKLGFENIRRFSWDKCCKEVFEFYQELCL